MRPGILHHSRYLYHHGMVLSGISFWGRTLRCVLEDVVKTVKGQRGLLLNGRSIHDPCVYLKQSCKMRPMCSSSAASKGIAAIVGVGPRLGRSIARKFAHEGYTVAILSRDLGKLSGYAEEIAREAMAQVFAIRIDCASTQSVREAFEGVLSLGYVEVLVYNACAPTSINPLRFSDVSVDSFQTSLAVSAVGAFQCSQLVIPGMVERGKGTIIFTGSSASVNASAGFYELSCAKFALRGLAQCLAKEYQAFGVHVAHVIVDGLTGDSRTSKENQNQNGMDPDAIAQTYWHLHIQDKRAWTHEIDIRPATS
ncbi:uncharacterized oxidoreductase SA2266 isoform X1 [Dioscorea cayenensis subsp. rotundata]|uniref:Uncharacterized oxidoreductase SA2266 isoform X1 n=1 Tax=Dioscorea cayennensis subsp. rotundata TaxID=55577 RepID=A0AB40D381_DIOCR|nr:uncharacterized oxidoreductase SA2266 isoform X1 [Dioscorea cayenensis subsp. rotundata]